MAIKVSLRLLLKSRVTIQCFGNGRMTIAICVHAEDAPHYFGLSFVNSIVGVLLDLVAFGISTKCRDIVVPVNTPAGVIAALGLTQQCIA
ncbi:MAG: hypothetical protein O7B27_08305 [Gammaproteobacteria bacterium]|nr:hypothetical protein [Gammaproteobacteria bacterium]